MQITWNPDPVLIHFWGNFGIRYYGLIFSLVFLFGFFLFRWQVLRAGGSEDDAYAIVLPGALGTIIGARLGHVLFYNFDRFLADPLWVFRIWEGGLASHGAFIGLLIAILFYAHSLKQSYLECLDRFTFSATVAAIMVRIGNFFNSEIVGRVTDKTWGVRFPLYDRLPPELCPLRHPSQLYEASMGLIVMIILYLTDKALGREKRPRGVMAGTFAAAYFTGRFLVEFFKEYQKLDPTSSLTMGQYLSIPVALFGYALIAISLKRAVPAHWNPTVSRDKPSGEKNTSRTPSGKSTQRKKKR